MALERGVALAVFAIGLAVVAIALIGCGEDEGERRAEGCGEAHSSLRISEAELLSDRKTIRFAYAGAEPCMFAAEPYADRVYVELRTNTKLEDIDRTPPAPTGCAVGVLRRGVRPGPEVKPLSRTGSLLPRTEGARLLAAEPDCLEIPQGQASIIID